MCVFVRVDTEAAGQMNSRSAHAHANAHAYANAHARIERERERERTHLPVINAALVGVHIS